MSKIITRGELQAELAGQVKPELLEALPAKYFQDGHLPGAKHFPHDRVRAMALATVPDKNAPLVVYCASRTCQNSHIAAQTLEAMGYSNVRIYVGGKQDWVEAGLELELCSTNQQAA